MKKPIKVHMLPTEDKTHLHLSKDNFLSHSLGIFSKQNRSFGSYQHLYFTSDEEPKVGEHCFYIPLNEVMVFDKSEIWDKDKCRKIVATTDKSLLIEIESDSMRFDEPVGIPLPQISQQFIEEYCKASGIDEVLLEYEIIRQMYYPYQDIPILKTDQNNCVIVHPVKSTFSYDDITHAIAYGHSMAKQGLSHHQTLINYKQSNNIVYKSVEPKLGVFEPSRMEFKPTLDKVASIEPKLYTLDELELIVYKAINDTNDKWIKNNHATNPGDWIIKENLK